MTDIRYRGRPLAELSMIELQHGLKLSKDHADDLERRLSKFAIKPRNGKEHLQLYRETEAALQAELEARTK